VICKYFFVILLTVRELFDRMDNDTKLLKGIGKNLLKLREEKHISQKELADAMGIAQTQYGKVERGEVVPSLPTLLKAAKALNVTIDTIVYGDAINKHAENAGFSNSIFLDRLKVLDALKGEDKTIAIQVLDLVVAKEKMKNIVKDIHTLHK
jgi:transcriptional regulator with XRE-family HTH domain